MNVRIRRRQLLVISLAHDNGDGKGFVQCSPKLLSNVLIAVGIFKGQIELVRNEAGCGFGTYPLGRGAVVGI